MMKITIGGYERLRKDVIKDNLKYDTEFYKIVDDIMKMHDKRVTIL